MTVRGGSGRLPTFLIIGAMKAGTTSLYHYLRDHPQVFLPETKEIMFFDQRHNWHRGVGWYAAQFQGAPRDAIALGEASTSYTKFPIVKDAPERIATTLPDVRLVYLLRHPVERIRSHYLYNLARGTEWRTIADAVQQEPLYLDISRYAMQLERYLAHVDRERLLLLDSRELRDDRTETLRRVFGFLGVEETYTPATSGREYFQASQGVVAHPVIRRIRRSPPIRRALRTLPGAVKTLAKGLPSADPDLSAGAMSEEFRGHLERQLSPDIVRLRHHLADGFDGWGLG